MTPKLVLVAALLASPALAAAEKSGCQPGEGLPPFPVVDVTGKFSGQTVCYI